MPTEEDNLARLDIKLTSPGDISGSPPETLIIDVREPDEFARGHIPGAESVPLSDLHLSELELSKKAPVILVCWSGKRSIAGAKILLRLGFEQVYSLEGGMQAYINAGFTVDHK